MLPKSRYDVLLKLIEAHKPRTIIEVGCWNGLRAVEMLRAARAHRKRVAYVGYDLFEDATPGTDSAELNVKPHIPVAEVTRLLQDFAKSIKGVNWTLHKGNTRDTLHSKDALQGLKKPILAFIDGGHSVDTIRGDYQALKKADFLVMDDYYSKDDKGLSPDTEKFGCNKVIKEAELDGIMAGSDPVKGGGKVALFVYPADKFPGQVQLRVQTRNCVPNTNILANVSYSSRLITTFIKPCDPHDLTAVFVSAPPNIENFFDQIRELSKDPNNYLVCVKHSHDKLIATGIVPWACVLLDPRPHVQTFIQNPHPQVNYLTATMVHPTSIDKLVEGKARILGYNALVGAGEEEVLPKGSYLINGGTTAAVRGISVFHFLGFRKFKLFGYDSSHEKPKNIKERTKTGQQKYYQINSCGKNFWSDAELVAQAQDFEMLMKVTTPIEQAVDIEVFGEGLVQTMFRTKKQQALVNRDFRQEYGKQ